MIRKRHTGRRNFQREQMVTNLVLAIFWLALACLLQWLHGGKVF